MKEEKLLRALGSIDGSLILEAKEAPMYQTHTKLRRPVRVALIAAAIIVLLAVTASAVYVATQWDQIFQARFQPSQTVQDQLEGNLDQPEASVTRNGVTLSVRQTLCDEHTLYAVVEMQLPEDFDMSRLVVDSAGLSEDTLKLFASYDEASGQWYMGPATATAEWFVGEIPDEALESCTQEELCQDYFSQTLGGSFLPRSVDVENRTVTYLLMTDTQESFQDTSLTVWFSSITLDGETPVIDGPIYLTWTLSYSDDNAQLYSIEKDGEVVGALTISPLSLQIVVDSVYDVLPSYQDYTSQGYSTLEEAMAAGETEEAQWKDILTIYFDDGSTRTASESYSEISGGLQWNITFNPELLDVESVTKITIGELTVDLK